MTDTPEKRRPSPRTLSLLLTLWSLNAQGKTPTMATVILTDAGSVNVSRSGMESRRTLLRKCIARDLVRTADFKQWSGHSLHITDKGIAYLRWFGYPVSSPRES